jgi:hypothetical protein
MPFGRMDDGWNVFFLLNCISSNLLVAWWFTFCYTVNTRLVFQVLPSRVDEELSDGVLQAITTTLLDTLRD